MHLQLLDSRMIMRYSVWAEGESHPRGLGFVFPSASEDEVDVEDTSDDEDDTMGEQGPEAEPSSDAISSPQFLAFQRQMEEHNKSTRREMRRLAARQDHMFDAMNLSFASLNKTLRSFNPIAQFPYQQLGSMSRFPPSDSEEIEEHNTPAPQA